MKKLLLTTLITGTLQFAIAQPCIPNTHSLNFNGNSQYLTVANQAGLDITDSITVEAWIFPTQWAATSAQNSVVCKHGWSAGEQGYVLRVGGTGQLSFNFAGLDTTGTPVSWIDNISPAGALTINTWNHIAGTFDGTQSVIYINGVAQGTTPFTGTIVSSSYPLTIGRLSDGAQAALRYFGGFMDEVRIWHRALSAAEILSQKNDHIDPATATGLVSYWRMNDGTGTTATELVGGHNATTNGNLWSALVPFNSAPPTPAVVFNGTLLVSNASSGNQWYLNGVLIPGATQMTYAPTVNGAYTVMVTNTSGCTATSNPYNVTTVSLQEQIKTESIFLSPNPAHVVITIEHAFNSPTLITVSDLSGKAVLKQVIMGNSIQLPVAAIKSGCYLIELSNDDGKVYSRFIKQ